MEGTAHLPALEQPADFAALLRDFLGRLGQWGKRIARR